MPLITLNALSKIIQGKLNVNEKEARRYAEVVMDIFGYDDSVIDNMLDHSDRRLFYRLELEGILNTRRDEALLSDGTIWRIRYWEIQKNSIFPSEIKKKGRNIRIKNKNVPSYSHHTIYSSLPDTVWTARKTHVI
jgi:pantothenate kinase